MAVTVVTMLPGMVFSGMSIVYTDGEKIGALRFLLTVMSTVAVAVMGGFPPSCAWSRN